MNLGTISLCVCGCAIQTQHQIKTNMLDKI